MQVVVHVDGGARGNPGPAAAAAVVSAPDGSVLDEASVTLGHATNNVAEYRALLLGLERAAALGATEVEVVNDSELIARQVDGTYKVKNADLRPLHAQAKAALEGFARWSIRSVPRAENAAADALVNRALDGEATGGGSDRAGDELTAGGSDRAGDLLSAGEAEELWLTLIRHELAAAREELADGRPQSAAPRLRRVVAVERSLAPAPGARTPKLERLYEAFRRGLDLPDDRDERLAALAALYREHDDPLHAAWHEVAELLLDLDETTPEQRCFGELREVRRAL